MSRNVFQRFLEVQKSVRSIVKNETVEMNSSKSYKAVSHDDVAAALHGPLADAGIVMLPDVVKYESSQFDKETKYGVQTWYRTDLEIRVKWINAEKPDDYFESTGAAFALDTSDKGFAKAYSLALKIILLKVHLLESRDEEEKRIFDDEPSVAQSRKNQPKPKQDPRPASPAVEKIEIDPADFVMTLGTLKGKKLKEIGESELKAIRDWGHVELKKGIPALGAAKHEALYKTVTNIDAFLASVGVEK